METCIYKSNGQRTRNVHMSGRSSVCVSRARAGERPTRPGGPSSRPTSEKAKGRAKECPSMSSERSSRPRRRIPTTEELQETIKGLQCQVESLKLELYKAHALNAKLASDLATALAPTPHQREAVEESPKFRDIQKLIANKLQFSAVKEPATASKRAPSSSFLPPPPPPPPLPSISQRKSPPPLPPPPPPRSARAPTNHKAPADAPSLHKHTPVTAHTSIVGEIQNRSAHLLAIKADIETKADFINGLIAKVLAAAYVDIEDVVKFVEWLDGQLSSLADERAVLKHFKWPEKKADALREAAIEYRDLKLLETEISSAIKYDMDTPRAAALKKVASLLDKSERSIQRLVKLRSSVLRCYEEYKIPIDWMLDSGIVRQIQQASMNVIKMLTKNSDTDQFAGGLDSETLCAFEDIRRRFSGGLQPKQTAH